MKKIRWFEAFATVAFLATIISTLYFVHTANLIGLAIVAIIGGGIGTICLMLYAHDNRVVRSLTAKLTARIKAYEKARTKILADSEECHAYVEAIRKRKIFAQGTHHEKDKKLSN